MNILHIHASSKTTNSVSKEFGEKVVTQLGKKEAVFLKERHTTYSDLPFVTEEMMQAFFVKGERTEAQDELLGLSQELVDEVIWADTLVISTPIYNFSVPASLKAYFDLIARAGLTFKYTEKGPVGLLENKSAILVVSSGGTKIGSDIDFADRYMKHFLSFIGIKNVQTIHLDQLNLIGEAKQKEALASVLAL